ncbi:MAG: hypothetical protein M1828_002568 [Chrysothrix sp. TS-e1954]|nr:MAG: hypothetical protein M1828_002568 [Chrysothrix sp. TS-e1954]
MGSRPIKSLEDGVVAPQQSRSRKSGELGRSNVTQACAQCRTRRVRCGGQRPKCQACIDTSLDCVYEQGTDRRSTQYKQRTSIEIQKRLAEYEMLISRFQNSNEIEATRLLTRLGLSGIAGVTNLTVKNHDNPLEQILTYTSASGAQVLETLRRGFTAAFQSGARADYLEFSPRSGVADLYRLRGEEENWHATLRVTPQPRSTMPTVATEASSIRGRDTAALSQSEFNEDMSTPMGGTRDPKYMRAFGVGSGRYATPGYVHIFGNLPLSSALVAAGHQSSTQARQTSNFMIPNYLIQPLAEYEGSTLSRAYLDYRDEARGWLAKGDNPLSVIGPDYVNVDLFFRERHDNDPRTVCFWASRLVNAFQQQQSLWQRLALAGFLTHFMRWLLNPTEGTYALVPEMFRPTPTQRFLPHHPTADLAIFAEVRDALVHHFRDHVTIMEGVVFLNWPYTLDEAVEIDQTDLAYKLTPMFEAFSANRENWSVNRVVVDVFPELTGRVRVED